MTLSAPHEPVLRDRVAALVDTAPDGVVLDATLGAGGHAEEILRRRIAHHGRGRLVGVDRDPEALLLAEERLAPLRVDADIRLVRARFDELDRVLSVAEVDRLAAVVADLGLSSMQLDAATRGFSYRQDGPIDMRMDPDGGLSAAEIVNEWPVAQITRILRTYGEEPSADRIARAIVAARPFTSTVALADVVRSAIPAALRRTGGHPATRTFQALRIAVNGELDALEAFLPAAIDRLQDGGVLVVISYHSLEDRIVKRALADAARGCVCPPQLPVCGCGRQPLVTPLVKRSETPGDDEISRNPRARSARLRAVTRTSHAPRTADLEEVRR